VAPFGLTIEFEAEILQLPNNLGIAESCQSTHLWNTYGDLNAKLDSILRFQLAGEWVASIQIGLHQLSGDVLRYLDAFSNCSALRHKSWEIAAGCQITTFG
jgi:hypothetical protein